MNTVEYVCVVLFRCSENSDLLPAYIEPDEYLPLCQRVEMIQTVDEILRIENGNPTFD